MADVMIGKRAGLHDLRSLCKKRASLRSFAWPAREIHRHQRPTAQILFSARTMISRVRHYREPRVQYHDRVIRYVFVDHRVGADFHVVPDGYFSEYPRARPEVDVVSDRRHPRPFALPGQADRQVLGNIAIASDDDIRRDRDCAEMADVEPRTDRRGTWKFYSPHDLHEAIQDKIDRMQQQPQRQRLRVQPLAESENDHRLHS